MSSCNYGVIETPIVCPVQRWMPTLQHPYPMNFVQAPSASHQILVNYNGTPQLQGLSVNTGPVMYPVPQSTVIINRSGKSPIAYPTTHSIPGPYLRSYINLAGPCGRKTYTY